MMKFEEPSYRERVERQLERKLVQRVCVHFISQADFSIFGGQMVHGVPQELGPIKTGQSLTKEGSRLHGATFKDYKAEPFYERLIDTILLLEEKYNLPIPD